MDGFFSTTPGLVAIMAAQSLLVIGFVMVSLLFLVYGDRKIWAAVQMRRGPNVVGAFGLLQTVADALKYVVKEVVVPAGADRPVFLLAPMTSFVLAMIDAVPENAWPPLPAAAMEDGDFGPAVDDHYLTNPTARASALMAELSAAARARRAAPLAAE